MLDVLDHQCLQRKLFDNALYNPALTAGAGLLERDCSAGINVGQHAPANIDGME